MTQSSGTKEDCGGPDASDDRFPCTSSFEVQAVDARSLAFRPNRNGTTQLPGHGELIAGAGSRPQRKNLANPAVDCALICSGNGRPKTKRFAQGPRTAPFRRQRLRKLNVIVPITLSAFR